MLVLSIVIKKLKASAIVGSRRKSQVRAGNGMDIGIPGKELLTASSSPIFSAFTEHWEKSVGTRILFMLLN